MKRHPQLILSFLILALGGITTVTASSKLERLRDDAYYALANWDYTRRTERLEHYDTSSINIFGGVTTTGIEVFVVVFPRIGETSPCAYAYFKKVGDQDFELLSIGYTVESISNLKTGIEDSPADWVLDPMVPETIYIRNESKISCFPTSIEIGESVLVKLGVGHGKELAVRRIGEDVSLFLVVGNAPSEMDSLMSPGEFELLEEFVILPETTGFRWELNGKNEPVFSKPGHYEIYVSESLESETGGYYCEVTVSNP